MAPLGTSPGPWKYYFQKGLEDHKSDGFPDHYFDDLKRRRKFPYCALKDPSETEVMIGLRNGNYRSGYFRKAKIAVPNRTPNGRDPKNLGLVMKRYPLVRIRPKGPLCGYVSRILKQKTNEAVGFLEKSQKLLVGTVYDTDFIHFATVQYARTAAGLTQISKTPSLGATRLILHQLLRCRSSFPWERLLAHCALDTG